MSTNNVIITADDYGVCNFIDNAILSGLRSGKIKAVSAMLTHPTSVERLKRLLQLQIDLSRQNKFFGIGLHFSITSGKPVLNRANSLTESIDPLRFHDFKYYPFKSIDPEDLYRELKAQIELMESIIGVGNIDHIANHHSPVYFEGNMFLVYARLSAEHKIPMRSPMSWNRKFGKIKKYRLFGKKLKYKLPDYDDKFLTPVARQGLKMGVWRKLGQVSYGNILKRMNHSRIDYPDVLYEYIYGFCAEDIDKGEEVINHALEHLAPRQFKFVEEAHEYTRHMSNNGSFRGVLRRYLALLSPSHISVELMFHLGLDGPSDEIISDIPDNSDLHGINGDYFKVRSREFQCLDTYDWAQKATDYNLNYISYKQMSWITS